MILRNISPRSGLCNGTRAIITNLSSRVIEVWILGGEHAGELHFIPRISLTPSNEELPFKLKCCQFPVRVAFAMTINKSQGQSVRYVGIDFHTPVFAHGQFYVAMSRCTSGFRIKVLLPENANMKTKNIVWKALLLL